MSGLDLRTLSACGPAEHAEFRRLIEDELRLEIQYESIYRQRFTVVYLRREWASSPPAKDRP
jgi:hypothetical protein